MKIASRRRFWLIATLLIADSVVFNFTNPHEVPSFMLIAGFLLFAVSVYCLLLGILMALGWYGVSSSIHRRRLARVVTGVVAGLAALQSIGELSPRDVLVLLPLATLVYLYIAYGQANKTTSA